MLALFGLIKAIGARLVRFNSMLAVVDPGEVPILLPRTSIVAKLASSVTRPRFVSTTFVICV